MKFHYYPETDSLYIDLSEKKSADSPEVITSRDARWMRTVPR